MGFNSAFKGLNIYTIKQNTLPLCAGYKFETNLYFGSFEGKEKKLVNI
jgi:hypothetical protein